MSEYICEICHLTYKEKIAKHSCCSKQCLEIKKNREANARWLKRERKPNDPGHNLKIERRRVYNNDYLFKKFNACRG